MSNILSGIIGDNANLHAGVLTIAELDDLMETVWSEAVECPACGGSGDANWCHPCEWCEGEGLVTRAEVGEWVEARR